MAGGGGMTPYYADDLVTIYHGDCREWMPEADVIVTDPPYGLPNEDAQACAAVILAAEPAVSLVFSDWRSSHVYGALPGKVGELIWEYGWISGGRTRAKSGVLPTHNTIHCFGDPLRLAFLDGTIIKRQPGFSSPRQCSWAKKTGHPHEKPLRLMRYLVAGVQGGTILDPFMGSGSTVVAARELGRRAIGIEIEERYCEIAANRCRQEVLGLGA